MFMYAKIVTNELKVNQDHMNNYIKELIKLEISWQTHLFLPE